jgi:ethanolamine-phosphate cytidylyltransferase
VEGTTTKRNKDENLLEDPYLVPKKLGIFQQIESKYSLDTDEIAKRLLFRREHFIKKYENKKKKEDEYYNEKKYIEEI